MSLFSIRVISFTRIVLMGGAVLFCSAAFLFPVIALAQSGERIDTFDADIVVNENGTVVITETIEYNFPSDRHGIYRDLPTKYDVGDGEILYVPLEVSGVHDALGRPHVYTVSQERFGIRVKIGDANRYVKGLQTYVITYTAVGALRYFDDHDELYWNVTGNEWTVPIRRVNAVVYLPGNITSNEIMTRCFTGDAGSQDQHCLGNVQGSSAHFVAEGPLTIVVGWPPGRVAKVEAVVVSRDYGALMNFLPFLVPLFVFGILIHLWRKHGRDRGRRGTIMVRYEPPKGLTPAEVGVIVDERAEMHDITATIVDLAVRRYITIKEAEPTGLIFKSKDFEFVEEKKDTKGLKPFELLILSVLFKGGRKSVTVSHLKKTYAFQDHLKTLKDALYERVTKRGYFPNNPERVRVKFVVIGIVVAVLGYIVFRVGLQVVFMPDNMVAQVNMVIAMVMTVILFIGFAPLMPRKTKKGSEVAEHALGLKDYIETAEKYRLQWQEKEKVFETFLPYAMVFGVVEKYVKAFDGLDMEQPDWYHGRDTTRFNAALFASGMLSFESGMKTAIQSKPQKSSGGSGFGGGGFSGGGFGGGGGGSW